MKNIMLCIILFSAVMPAYCTQRHYCLDSLPSGSGIDLDSGTVRTIDRMLRSNPYVRHGGTYDSTARYDIAWTQSGLLWCFCDAYNLVSFFPGFFIKLPLESIVRFSASDTLSPAKASPVSIQPDSMRRLNANSSGSTVFLVKTNKSNWAMIKATYIAQSMIVCGPPPQMCLAKVNLEWWLQDDGSLSFADLTCIRQAGKKSGRVSGSAAKKYPEVNLRGQIVKSIKFDKASSMDKLKRGIPVVSAGGKK